MPYLAVNRVEQVVVDHYRTLDLPPGFAERVSAQVAAALAEEQETVQAIHDSVTKQLKDLEAREERLIDLAADGELPQGRIRVRLQKLHTDRRRLEAELIDTSEQLAKGAVVIGEALALLQDVWTVYHKAPDPVRGHLNHTFFERIYLSEYGVAESELTAPFRSLSTATAPAGLDDGMPQSNTNGPPIGRSGCRSHW